MMALRFIIINKDGSLSKDFNDFLMKWPGFLGVTSSSTSSKSSEWSPLTTGVWFVLTGDVVMRRSWCCWCTNTKNR